MGPLKGFDWMSMFPNFRNMDSYCSWHTVNRIEESQSTSSTCMKKLVFSHYGQSTDNNSCVQNQNFWLNQNGSHYNVLWTQLRGQRTFFTHMLQMFRVFKGNNRGYLFEFIDVRYSTDIRRANTMRRFDFPRNHCLSYWLDFRCWTQTAWWTI